MAFGIARRVPQTTIPEEPHALDNPIRKRRRDAIFERTKLGTVEEEADESSFWLEMLRDILELRSGNDERRTPVSGSTLETRHSKLDTRTSQELERLLDEADQLVAITVASKKTARGAND